MAEDKFMVLSRRFWEPGVQAIVLMGSQARGQAGPFSDVDIVRLVDGATGLAGSHWVEGSLVTVSDATPEQVESWFTEPQEVVKWMAGLRVVRPLLDPSGLFTTIQDRAYAFIWDEAMQAKANCWVSREMVGWIEEVHKGLEGLRRGDIGRLINARHGLSWGMNGVMVVYKGVLLSGDNGVWDEVAAATDLPSEWVALRNKAFAVNGLDGVAPSLREQVEAGLQLYTLTARLVAPALQGVEREMVTEVAERTALFLTSKAKTNHGAT